MNVRRFTATAVLTIAALGAGSGVSFAEPAPAAPDVVKYHLSIVEKSVVATLEGGKFEVAKDNKSFSIADNKGNVLVTMPLEAKVDTQVVPISQAVNNDGREIKLTPDTSKVTPTQPLALKPVASLLENERAQNAFLTQLGVATAVGGLVGTIIGAGLGLIGIIGGPTVIASVVAGAGIGGIVGTIVAGGPTLIAAGIDLIQTLTAPPGSTKWNYAEPK